MYILLFNFLYGVSRPDAQLGMQMENQGVRKPFNQAALILCAQVWGLLSIIKLFASCHSSMEVGGMLVCTASRHFQTHPLIKNTRMYEYANVFHFTRWTAEHQLSPLSMSIRCVCVLKTLSIYTTLSQIQKTDHSLILTYVFGPKVSSKKRKGPKFA